MKYLQYTYLCTILMADIQCRYHNYDNNNHHKKGIWSTITSTGNVLVAYISIAITTTKFTIVIAIICGGIQALLHISDQYSPVNACTVRYSTTVLPILLMHDTTMIKLLPYQNTINLIEILQLRCLTKLEHTHSCTRNINMKPS